MENAATAGFWLSPQQQYVWSLQQEGAAYRSVCLVQIDGVTSTEGPTSALNRLVARHEILRTIYIRQAGMTYPFQVVLESATPGVETIDFSRLTPAEQSARLSKLFEREREALSSGPEQAPILTAKIVSLGSNR